MGNGHSSSSSRSSQQAGCQAPPQRASPLAPPVLSPHTCLHGAPSSLTAGLCSHACRVAARPHAAAPRRSGATTARAYSPPPSRASSSTCAARTAPRSTASPAGRPSPAPPQATAQSRRCRQRPPVAATGSYHQRHSLARSSYCAGCRRGRSRRWSAEHAHNPLAPVPRPPSQQLRPVSAARGWQRILTGDGRIPLATPFAGAAHPARVCPASAGESLGSLDAGD